MDLDSLADSERFATVARVVQSTLGQAVNVDTEKTAVEGKPLQGIYHELCDTVATLLVFLVHYPFQILQLMQQITHLH